MPRTTWTLALASLFVAACAAAPESEVTGESRDELVIARAGAVFTSSNDPNGNAVVVYRRAPDGSLQFAASYATAGKGTGDGLGSQGALTLSRDGRHLFAVNAGSDELSVFRVFGESLFLLDTVPTGGVRPVSVTEHNGLVYVVHAGDAHNDVTGFVLDKSGSLAAIPGSTRALSAPTTGPAEVAFSPSGRALVVTEKATNKIDEFRVDPHTGLLSNATVHESHGRTPFGFSVTSRGQIVVSEAFAGADAQSAVSSYQLGSEAGLFPVSASVPNAEGAACWVALAHDNVASWRRGIAPIAFVANTKSGSISAYTVGGDGHLFLTGGRAADTGAGSKPADLAVSRDDRFLYVLEGGTHTLGVVRIDGDALTVLPDVEGLPEHASGLLAF